MGDDATAHRQLERDIRMVRRPVDAVHERRPTRTSGCILAMTLRTVATKRVPTASGNGLRIATTQPS